MSNTKKNKHGGSAGGGGYDYQAEAYALIAAKILAEDNLPWVDSGCDRIPVSIRLETGAGGDDLRIYLKQGAKIELQAKSGRLKRNADLWQALLGIAGAVKADSNTHGVLLVTSEASLLIRKQLKNGIPRLGEGIVEDSAEIVQDFIKKLQDAGITDLSICLRIRIEIRDFEPGAPGEYETLEVIKKTIAKPELAGLVRGYLVSDGLDLIKQRSGRDAVSIAGVLRQNSIELSSKVSNQLVLREAFLDWSIKINENFSIPSLNVALPVSRAWVRLRAMPFNKEDSGSKSLEEQIKNYHEWYRLTHTSRHSKPPKIESISRNNRLVVVVGGPGSGKSTLLRRLAHTWSADGKLVLRVSLRPVALRMRNGETFDEAVLAVACEGFPNKDAHLFDLLRTSNCLLADGLDETDPDRLDVADKLRRWALSSNERSIILTTRPIGHNPAWFKDWAHFELLPLDEEAINKFVVIIFGLLSPANTKSIEQQSRDFTNKLKLSRTASIAARNPQLLGFLIALFINGYEIDRKRFHLFSDMIEQIRKHTVHDRKFRQEMDMPTAIRFIDHLGWTLLHNPSVSEEELVKAIGELLASEVSEQPLKGKKMASDAIIFWEERGLLERVSSGVQTTLTFVHLAFQEFSAARFLSQLSDNEVVEWVKANKNIPKYRETLFLSGGTERVVLTVNTLLEDDNPSDPIQINALLAADVLGEAEYAPRNVQDRTIKHLLARLTYLVPDVVYEAGEKLKPLAIASPELIGPVALQLAQHEQRWTSEVACTLGLLCGEQYVDAEALLSVYTSARSGDFRSGRLSSVIIDSKPIINTLIEKGAEYLLKGKPPETHVEAVKERYKSGRFPANLEDMLWRMLFGHLNGEDFERIHSASFSFMKNWDKYGDLSRKSGVAILEAIIAACQGLTDQQNITTADPESISFVRLWKALEFGENPVQIYYEFGDRPLEEALIEVIRSAVIVFSLQPAQVQADAEQVLLELKQSGKEVYEFTKGLKKRKFKIKPQWILAQGQQLKPELLFEAISHPSWHIARFAALLLLNCFDRSLLQTGFKQVLATGSEHAIDIIIQLSKDLWQDEASELFLTRLEQNLTADCYPLIGLLGNTRIESLRDRFESVLRAALVSEEAELVYSALEVIEKLGLDKEMEESIKQSYRWWQHEGPLDPIGSGAVPKNPAASLFSHLIRRKMITFKQACEAASISRSDLQEVAIKAIGYFLEQKKDLFDHVINEVLCERLPISVVDELSMSHPSVCSGQLESFLKLLESKNQDLHIACIRALGDGWAERHEAEAKLRLLLSSPDLKIRNEAYHALRKLATKAILLPSS